MTFSPSYSLPNPLPPASEMMEKIRKERWNEAAKSRRNPSISPVDKLNKLSKHFHESDAAWRRNRPEVWRY